MRQFNIINKFVYFLFSIFGSFSSLSVSAQSEEKINPFLLCIEENGITLEKADTLEADIMFEGSAPMKIVCNARVKASEGETWHSEWDISDSPAFETILYPRFEDETEFDLNDSGTYYIRLLVTFTDENGKTEDISSSNYIIKISESQLKVPNAFSPNGDGINDVFRVTYKSLIKFNAYVFNRWGQQLYHWAMSNIDDGWDGTFKGKQVKDGVYFIVIEAEGADGRKFKHKGDINILRGFSGTGSTNTTPQE